MVPSAATSELVGDAVAVDDARRHAVLPRQVDGQPELAVDLEPPRVERVAVVLEARALGGRGALLGGVVDEAVEDVEREPLHLAGRRRELLDAQHALGVLGHRDRRAVRFVLLDDPPVLVEAAAEAQPAGRGVHLDAALLVVGVDRDRGVRGVGERGAQAGGVAEAGRQPGLRDLGDDPTVVVVRHRHHRHPVGVGDRSDAALLVDVVRLRRHRVAHLDEVAAAVVAEPRLAPVARHQPDDGATEPHELDGPPTVVLEPDEARPAVVVERGRPDERSDDLAEQPVAEDPGLTEVRRPATPAEVLRLALDRGVEVEVRGREEPSVPVGRERGVAGVRTDELEVAAGVDAAAGIGP